jgi:hypothetical protein
MSRYTEHALMDRYLARRRRQDRHRRHEIPPAFRVTWFERLLFAFNGLG